MFNFLKQPSNYFLGGAGSGIFEASFATGFLTFGGAGGESTRSDPRLPKVWVNVVPS
jgi:hypothetical protein